MQSTWKQNIIKTVKHPHNIKIQVHKIQSRKNKMKHTQETGTASEKVRLGRT